MDLGNIDIEIIAQNASSCLVENLNSPDNDFEPGAIDVFEGDQIGDCYNFEVPDYDIIIFRITHSGIGGWKPEWFRVFFFDGALVQCFDGEWIDNNEVHELYDCELLKATLPRRH